MDSVFLTMLVMGIRNGACAVHTVLYKMKTVTIELPGIKAVSRNETTGHYFSYRTRLNEAENWMLLYGKPYEYHFAGPVDVSIEAYYDTTLKEVNILRGKRAGTRVKRWQKVADTPNIDDKIFTDILVRHKPNKKHGPIERRVWFIEDDSPLYLRTVTKRAIASDHYKVLIIISEVKV